MYERPEKQWMNDEWWGIREIIRARENEEFQWKVAGLTFTIFKNRKQGKVKYGKKLRLKENALKESFRIE